MRWLHSLVTSMIPSTGSRIEQTNAAPATRSPYCEAVVLGRDDDRDDQVRDERDARRDPDQPAAGPGVEGLAELDRNSRVNGMPGVPATSNVAGGSPAVLT